MIYSDEENRRWWVGLSVADQRELAERVRDNARVRGLKLMAERILGEIKIRQVPSSGDLADLRKWAR